MPAWGNGTPEGERESWGLTPEDIECMEGLNPMSPAAVKEREEIRRFLQRESPAPVEHEKERKN